MYDTTEIHLPPLFDDKELQTVKTNVSKFDHKTLAILLQKTRKHTYATKQSLNPAIALGTSNVSRKQ